MNDISTTLAERGSRYGSFDEHARITQNLKRAMQDSPNWKTLNDAQKEALEMVQHKIGRILNGDPNYHDSWHDMIGYTKLVADALVPKEIPSFLREPVHDECAHHWVNRTDLPNVVECIACGLCKQK